MFVSLDCFAILILEKSNLKFRDMLWVTTYYKSQTLQNQDLKVKLSNQQWLYIIIIYSI